MNTLQFDQNVHIQNYFNMEEPDKETIAKAYSERNKEMRLNFDDVFKCATDKLCLSPNSMKSLINNLFKLEVKKKVDDYLKNENKGELIFDYKKFYDKKMNSLEYQSIIVKYNQLLKFKEEQDYYGFYMALTIDELYDLGF